MRLSYSTQHKYLVLLSLAVLNDAVDLLGLANPLAEVLFDLLIVALIHVLLRSLNPLVVLVTLLDIVPGIDIAPFWSLYVIYLYLSGAGEKKKVRVRVEG